jgi:hypothetical protein
MSIAYLVVLIGFYYVSLVFYMCLGVMDNHGEMEVKGSRGYKHQTKPYAVWEK